MVHSSHRMYCNSKCVLLTNIQTSFLLSVPTVSFYKSKCSPSLLSKRRRLTKRELWSNGIMIYACVRENHLSADKEVQEVMYRTLPAANTGLGMVHVPTSNGEDISKHKRYQTVTWEGCCLLGSGLLWILANKALFLKKLFILIEGWLFYSMVSLTKL